MKSLPTSDHGLATALPLLDLNDPDAVAAFVLHHLELDR